MLTSPRRAALTTFGRSARRYPFLLVALTGVVGCRPTAGGHSSATADTSGVVTTVTTTDTLGVPPAPAATPARTDRCRYADARPEARPGDGRFGQPYDTAAMSRGVTLRCTLRAGGPEVRLVVSGAAGIPMGIDVHLPPDAPQPLQQLTMDDNDEPAREGGDLVLGEDLNRDGWTDLKAQTWSGSGGVFYDVFMFDPRRRRFVKDTVLSGAGSVVPRHGATPCVGTGRRSGAGTFYDADYCWSGSRWALANTLTQEGVTLDGRTRWIRTLREPRGGVLVVVLSDTLADPNAGLEREP